MTNTSGNQVESTNYMPFGGMRAHSGTTTSNYKFTDQELDAENGLYNYNARMYDPIIGRFISADPIVPEPYNPQSLNRYSYCLNNPLIYVDPSGYEEKDEYVCPEIIVTGSRSGDDIVVTGGPQGSISESCTLVGSTNVIEINPYDIKPSSNFDPWKGYISGDALYLWLRGINSGQDPLLTGLLMGNIAAQWMARQREILEQAWNNVSRKEQDIEVDIIKWRVKKIDPILNSIKTELGLSPKGIATDATMTSVGKALGVSNPVSLVVGLIYDALFKSQVIYFDDIELYNTKILAEHYHQILGPEYDNIPLYPGDPMKYDGDITTVGY